MNPIVYFTDWVKCGVLSFAVAVTSVAQPYVKFTREPEIRQDIPLKQKAALFDSDLLSNHITSEDVFLYEKPVNLGDMCIWNGVHVAYRAIRYGTTHDPEDLKQLKRFMISLEKLQTHPITGKTILLRARIPLAEYDGSHGGYREVYQNDTMIWQEDASGDSFAGQVYGIAMAWKYGDQEVKDFVGILARELYLTMKAHHYQLHNSKDDKPTKFSAEGPSVTSAPMSITSYLVLTKVLELQYPNDLEVGHEYHKWAITWNQIHVASHNMAFFLWKMKYSGINQAKMALHALLELETNEHYRRHYILSLRRGWGTLGEDGDTYLTYIFHHVYPKAVNARQLQKGKQTLQEFATDMKVDHAVDLTGDPEIHKTNWDGKKAVQPYPVWARPPSDFIWQRDHHEVLGGGCCTKYSGLDFLLAYYVGLSYGYIDSNE